METLIIRPKIFFFFSFLSKDLLASAGIWTWLYIWKCLGSDFGTLSLHHKTMWAYSVHFLLDYLSLENKNCSKQEWTSLDFWRCEPVKDYHFGLFCSRMFFVHLILFSMSLLCFMPFWCPVMLISKNFSLRKLPINCKWTTKCVLKFSFANCKSAQALHEDINRYTGLCSNASTELSRKMSDALGNPGCPPAAIL